MATETDWLGHTTTFSHDQDNNATGNADPNGTTITNTYNSDDVETNAAATTTSGGSPIVSYGTPRNGADQLASETDSVSGVSGSTTNYGYTNADQMSTVGSSSATYDGSGNPTGLTNGGAQNFDAAGELCWSASTAPTPTPADPDPRCSATAPSGSTTYAYDSMGDRTGTTTSSSSSSYLYNQTGELVDESPAGTSGYTTITPTRVCDTRSGNPSGLSGTYNQCNNSTLGAGGTVAVQLSETGGPIPSTGVSAVVANVTATNNSGSGSSYVTVYPTGTTAPATSNLNVSAGATVNNQVTVGVGTNGSGAPSITIYNYNDSVDVQVDVEGYYTTGSGGSGYVPVTPTRICDTRSGNPSGLSSPNNQCNGGSGNPGSPISAGGTLTVEAAGSLSSGYLQAIGATAVVADVTAISPSSSTYLTSYKQGASRPSTYSLNAPSGTTVDKEMTIALNTSNGEFVLYNSAGTVNVTVDVEGFFIGGSGNLYAPVSPSLRVCDTRTGNPSGLSSPYNQCNGDTIAAAGTLTVQVAGLAGVPSTAASVVVSITSLNETATGRLVAYQAGTSLPSVSTLNFTSGAKVNNEATIAVGTNGDIDIYNSAGTTDVLVDVLGYYGSNYTYNGDGLRMTKTINGTVSTFTYDTTQANPLVLEDGANAYVYGPSGEPVEQVSTSGTPLYFVSDQLGSTRALTNSSGTVVAQYTYGSLGNIATKTGSASTPIGFAGAYTDSETGFLYLLHRYYDPATGQFVSVDPLVAQTQQPYIYAGDNPVNETDPSGDGVGYNCGIITCTLYIYRGTTANLARFLVRHGNETSTAIGFAFAVACYPAGSWVGGFIVLLCGGLGAIYGASIVDTTLYAGLTRQCIAIKIGPSPIPPLFCQVYKVYADNDGYCRN